MVGLGMYIPQQSITAPPEPGVSQQHHRLIARALSHVRHSVA